MSLFDGDWPFTSALESALGWICAFIAAWLFGGIALAWILGHFPAYFYLAGFLLFCFAFANIWMFLLLLAHFVLFWLPLLYFDSGKARLIILVLVIILGAVTVCLCDLSQIRT